METIDPELHEIDGDNMSNLGGPKLSRLEKMNVWLCHEHHGHIVSIFDGVSIELVGLWESMKKSDFECLCRDYGIHISVGSG